MTATIKRRIVKEPRQATMPNRKYMVPYRHRHVNPYGITLDRTTKRDYYHNVHHTAYQVKIM